MDTLPEAMMGLVDMIFFGYSSEEACFLYQKSSFSNEAGVKGPFIATTPFRPNGFVGGILP